MSEKSFLENLRDRATSKHVVRFYRPGKGMVELPMSTREVNRLATLAKRKQQTRSQLIFGS